MTSAATYTNTFMPKHSIALTLGKHTVYIYPDIQPDMSHTEKSYGFMVTSSALESAESSQVCATGTTPLVGILQTRFIAHALQYIRTQNNFSVISYHGRNGRTLTNATLPNGQLKPVNNQTNANRRPTDIMFAKVESDIQFETIDPTIAGVFPFSFFIRLENQTIEVLNSTGCKAMQYSSTPFTLPITGTKVLKRNSTPSGITRTVWANPSCSSLQISMISTPMRPLKSPAI
jgi:hypothetical protein